MFKVMLWILLKVDALGDKNFKKFKKGEERLRDILSFCLRARGCRESRERMNLKTEKSAV